MNSGSRLGTIKCLRYEAEDGEEEKEDGQIEMKKASCRKPTHRHPTRAHGGDTTARMPGSAAARIRFTIAKGAAYEIAAPSPLPVVR